MKILLGAIYPYAFLLLYLIIPFDNYIRALPNILLVILVVAFPFVISKKELSKLKTTPVIIFFSFFLFLIINALIFGRLETDFNIIKKVLIAVGLLLLYIPVHDLGKLKRAIIYSSLATILFSIINIIIVNNTSGEFIFEDYPMLIESLLIDRIYLGFLSVLSILISYHSLRPKFLPENKYYLANIIVNLLFLFLIVSKIAILILVFVLVLRQFYGKNKKIRIPVTLLTILLLSVIYLSVKDDLKKQNFLMANNQTETNFVKNTLTWDIRTIVWHCSALVSNEMGLNLKGLGFSKTKDKLVDCYGENIENLSKRDKFMSERFNTHNQFIDFYLSTGILGLLLFVGLFVAIFLNVRKDFFATALLLVLGSYCFMENVFHRQLGAYYAGFILIILLTNIWKIKTIKE